MRLRARSAEAEDLDGVADVGEPVFARDFAAHASTCTALHLDGRAACPAHQMVMVVVGAAPVDRLAGVGAQRVDDAAAAICCRVRYTVVSPIPSPRLRNSSCSSWADRKSSSLSSSAAIAARCRVERTPQSPGAPAGVVTRGPRPHESRPRQRCRRGDDRPGGTSLRGQTALRPRPPRT